MKQKTTPNLLHPVHLIAVGFLGLASLVLQGDVHADGKRGHFDMHGPLNAITDIPGVQVGHVTRDTPPFLTGTTVVYATNGSTGGALVPGGWPGGVNVEVLQPGNRNQELHVAFLSGGSFFGLSTFSGIMDWLQQHGVGMKVGPDFYDTDPLVAGAIVYDLRRRGDITARPGPAYGYDAMEVAAAGPVQQGNVGAGTGTTTGGGLRLKGGVGTASVVLDNGIIVGALTVTNAVGTPVDFSNCGLRAAYLEIGNEFGDYETPLWDECRAVLEEEGIIDPDEKFAHPNTTIGVVATNATLTREQVNAMVDAAAEGHAIGIDPVAQLNDGDSFFGMATNDVEVTKNRELKKIYLAAKEVYARAVAHATLNATSVDNFSSYCDKFPSACDAAQQRRHRHHKHRHHRHGGHRRHGGDDDDDD